MLSARFQQTGSPAHPADHAGASRFPRAGRRHGRQRHHGDKRHRQRPQRQADRRPAGRLIIPASTSPLPPRERPGLPVGLTAHAAIRRCNHGARPFQHHHSVPCFRIAQGRAFPVRVDLLPPKCPVSRAISPGWGVKISSPCRVWAGFFRLAAGRAAAFRPSASSTALPEKPGRSCFHQCPGLGGAGCALGRIAQPGAQPAGRWPSAAGCGRCSAGEMPPSAPASQGHEAALRQAGGHRRQHRLHTCQRNDAGPGAQGTLHGQRRRAPVACAARHRQHASQRCPYALSRGRGWIFCQTKSAVVSNIGSILSGQVSLLSQSLTALPAPQGGAYSVLNEAALPLPLGEVHA